MKFIMDQPARILRAASFWVGGGAVAFGSLTPDLQSALLDAVGVPANRVPALLGAVFIAARLLRQKGFDGS